MPPPVTQIQNLHLFQDEQQNHASGAIVDSGIHRHCGSALHRASQSRRGTQGVSWVIFLTGTKRASLMTVGPSSRKSTNLKKLLFPQSTVFGFFLMALFGLRFVNQGQNRPLVFEYSRSQVFRKSKRVFNASPFSGQNTCCPGLCQQECSPLS